MSTSVHLTSRSRTCGALDDFRSSAMPRLLRLARCQGYASFACGCGGILCALLQRSPAGGSTLMTSAPKSDKITAALGPAMKLAKSTTFKPVKILSSAILISYARYTRRSVAGRRVAVRRLASAELRDSFFKEGRCAFLLVFRRGAEAEIGRFKQQALALAHLHSLV